MSRPVLKALSHSQMVVVLMDVHTEFRMSTWFLEHQLVVTHTVCKCVCVCERTHSSCVFCAGYWRLPHFWRQMLWHDVQSQVRIKWNKVLHWTLINNMTGVPGPHLLTPSCSHCVLDGDSEQCCASDFTVEDKMWAHSCAWRAQSEVLHTSAFPVKWWSSFECV